MNEGTGESIYDGYTTTTSDGSSPLDTATSATLSVVSSPPKVIQELPQPRTVLHQSEPAAFVPETASFDTGPSLELSLSATGNEAVFKLWENAARDEEAAEELESMMAHLPPVATPDVECDMQMILQDIFELSDGQLDLRTQ